MMNVISVEAIAAATVRALAAMATASWDAVAASPKLQMLLGVCALLLLMRGVLDALVHRTRRIR